MPKVAQGCGEDGDDCSGEVGRRAVGEGEAQKQVGQDRQREELRQRADAVDGEAAQPLTQVVAMGAKDEAPAGATTTLR